MKFKVDEWVLYCAFPDVASLKDDKRRAVVLEVLRPDDYYDYRIYVDDGSTKIKKVKEENLSPIN